MDINTSDRFVGQLQHLGVKIIFSVSGGFCSHLMEAIRSAGIETIHFAHEQACAMAADAYARIKKKPAVVLVTNGPGSSNTLTGVLGAFQDSIPMIIISGNVPTRQSIASSGLPLRQLGVQEANIIPVVENITKYAIQITDAKKIDEHLIKAWSEATSGRMAPVWLDIPLDLQNIPAKLTSKESTIAQLEKLKSDVSFDYHYKDIVAAINQSKRPIIISGSGIHLSNSELKFQSLIENLGIPTVCSWHATDLFDWENPLYVGNFGLIGERAANLAVQHSDLLIILGSRMSIPNVGYATELFSPNSKKIMVDIDENELQKGTLDIDLPIHGNLDEFLDGFDKYLPEVLCYRREKWLNLLNSWKLRFPVLEEEHLHVQNRVNSYNFIGLLSKKIKQDDIIVTDMGTSFTCTMQSMRNTGFNRLLTSSGCSSMGFGLPGAIGAYYADKTNRVICIAGDGGFQMNIQELQTIFHNKIPLKIFILNSDGYLAISIMQKNLFKGNYFGSTPSSGVSAPDFSSIAQAYGLSSIKINTLDQLESGMLDDIMSSDESFVCEIMIPNNQLMIPRVQSQIDENGKIMSGSIDTMYPYLSKSEVSQIDQELRHI